MDTMESAAIVLFTLPMALYGTDIDLLSYSVSQRSIREFIDAMLIDRILPLTVIAKYLIDI